MLKVVAQVAVDACDQEGYGTMSTFSDSGASFSASMGVVRSCL